MGESAGLVLAATVGLGATVVMDLWCWWLRSMGVATLDYAMLGRWCGHWLQGRWFHAPIQKSHAIGAEKPLGWVLHYLTGMVFAVAWLEWFGPWPGVWTALLFGVLTLVLPWLVMQPTLGAGLAASKTPRPWLSRGVSLTTHAIFGLAMWACWRLLMLFQS